MTTEAKVKKNRVFTPPCILSYPHLFEPAGFGPNDPKKYSAVFIFTEGTDLSKLEAAIDAAINASKYTMEDLKDNLPWRTDWKKKGYPKNSTFISAKTDTKPGVVMPFKGEDDRPAVLTNEALMYPGAKVRASLEAYVYDRVGLGVSFALANVQWLGDGDRIDGRVAAADDFDVVEQEAEDIADLL